MSHKQEQPPETVEAIFGAAVELNRLERSAYLDRACRENSALRQRVESLLRAHDAAATFLPDTPGNWPPRESPDAAGASMESSGTTIDRYQLLEKLGEGGFGVVYLAEQCEPVKRRVALKIIKVGMDNPELVARFKAERQTLAVMDHPNIAKVLDGGVTDSGRPYFVMELVRGIRITEFCDQKRLSLLKRLRLFVDVCHAIQHAHQKGIIHGDITPANILVAEHDLGTVGIPKVIDFGIARAVQPERAETSPERHQPRFGTPAYMSPEQKHGRGLDIDTRSDIYSLGVLLCELLIGTTPSKAGGFFDSGILLPVDSSPDGRPPAPSVQWRQAPLSDRQLAAERRGLTPPQLLAQLRGDLDAIVSKCLEPERTRRYETANALATDLVRHRQHLPVEAHPTRMSYLLRKWVRRNEAVFAVGTVLALLLLASGAISTALAIRARRAERKAQVEATRAREQAVLAEQQRQLAEQQTEAVRLLSYVHAMNVAQRYCQETNFGQGLELLLTHAQAAQDAQPDLRGFEWRYLYRLCRGNHALALPQHAQVAGKLAFSPDGHLLATFCWDRRLRLWRTEQETTKPLFQAEAVTGLGGFSNDGEQLVFSQFGGAIQSYELRSGQQRELLPGAGDLVAYSSPGHVAVTYSAGGEIVAWDTRTRQRQASFPGPGTRYLEFGWTEPVALSPDGNLLAIVETEHGPAGLRRDAGIRLWDVRTGQAARSLLDQRQLRSLCFSPDASWLAVGDGEGKVQLWNLTNGGNQTIVAHELPVLSIAFSPNGGFLATGSADETFRFWDIATGAARPHRLRGHVSGVFSVAFSPDGRRIASGSRERSVKIWDLSRADTLEEIRGLHTEDYGNFVFSPDGRLFAAGCKSDSVVVWNAATLETNSVLKGLRYAVAFSSDSKHLLASTGNELGYWCELAETRRQPLPSRADGWRTIKCVDMSPDRRLAALGHESGLIEIRELQSGKTIGSFQAHAGRVRTLSFSKDGATLVSGGSDRAVKLWLVANQSLLAEKVEHKGALCAATLSRDGTRLASGCGAGTLKIWDPANLDHALISIPCHKSAIRALDFSPDGRTLVSGGEDKTVKLWNVASFSLPSQREVASFVVSDKVRLVQFSPDGNLLAIVTDDGVLRLLRGVSLAEADEEIARLSSPRP